MHQDRPFAGAADSQEFGLTGSAGAHHGLQIPGCPGTGRLDLSLAYHLDNLFGFEVPSSHRSYYLVICGTRQSPVKLGLEGSIKHVRWAGRPQPKDRKFFFRNLDFYKAFRTTA